MNFITTVVIVFGVGVMSIVASFVILRIRKETHLHNFESNYEELQWAIKNKNIEKIIQYSNPLLWNDCMERKDYQILMNNIEKLILEYPELKDLKNEIQLLFEKNNWK
jgi:hypothetical protein